MFKVEDGRARLQRVEIGKTNGESVEVRAGLKPGERVMPHPEQSIADGAAVRVRSAGPGGG